jgi:Delta3,5-Delta2,4-dienoyl-CoA isomerase
MCWGLGMGLTCACDVRLSTSTARFRVNEADIGIIASFDTLRLLPKIVSNSTWIHDITLSAREFDANEALRVGFVSSVWKSGDEAIREGIKLAEMITARSPSSTKMTKQAILRSRNTQKGNFVLYLFILAVTLLTSKTDQKSKLRRYSRYSEQEIAADINRVLGVGILKQISALEKL